MTTATSASMEICIHQARNLRNICIYQNQDVYAKIFMVDKPECKISTNVINEGGQNPVFNESLRLEIQTMDSSLRCEMWMLSRIKNYLEDQLLGFLLLPLSDVVSDCGKPAREFELNSNEVFYSPVGFVELSFKFNEIVMGTSTSQPLVADDVVVPHGYVCCELDKIEFPDEVMTNEHERMASEYLSFPGNNSDNIDQKTDDGNHVVTRDDGSSGDSDEQCRVKVGVEMEEIRVVEEEIVDIYMKSMQQFSDALAKMKLPIDESGSSKVGESGLDEKGKATRVFYGSRAFF